MGPTASIHWCLSDVGVSIRQHIILLIPDTISPWHRWRLDLTIPGPFWAPRSRPPFFFCGKCVIFNGVFPLANYRFVPARSFRYPTATQFLILPHMGTRPLCVSLTPCHPYFFRFPIWAPDRISLFLGPLASVCWPSSWRGHEWNCPFRYLLFTRLFPRYRGASTKLKKNKSFPPRPFSATFFFFLAKK